MKANKKPSSTKKISQNYFVTRPTSRVLSVPGGKCSIDIFCDANSSHDKNRDRVHSKETPALKPALKSDSLTTVNATNATSKPSTKPADNKMTMASEAARNKQRATEVSMDLFGSASAVTCSNVITNRPASRVLQPPGGKSSDFIFG